MRVQILPNPIAGEPFWWPVIGAMLVALACARAGAGLDPVFSSYDAVPGRPLVIAVRPDAGTRPPASVTLRFPDGREVTGEVAAIRLTPPAAGAVRWLGRGPGWTVIRPREARGEAAGLAWFVLVDLPEGVIGQEIWLDGRPIALRWLPRPELLAARFGFNSTAENPLADPWASPLPESWRERPDLLAELEPAMADPNRRWRAVLATTGLHEVADEGVGPITPELLRSGLVEASGRVAPIEDRLLDAIDAMQQARWRVVLARVWAADPALSMRLRQALAGGAEFRAGSLGHETVVAPAWPADSASVQSLRDEILKDGVPAEERRNAAEGWLSRRQRAVLWVRDDADGSAPASIGAMWLPAGDTGLFPLGRGETTGRPDLLVTRRMSILRRVPIAGAGVSGQTGDGAGVGIGGMGPTDGLTPAATISYRLDGKVWRLPVGDAPEPATPPGVEIGPWYADRTMASWLAGVSPGPTRAISGVMTRRSVSAHRAGDSGWRLFFRVDNTTRLEDAEIRVWIGTRARPSAVITAGIGGRLEIQRFDGESVDEALPALVGAEVGAGDGERLIELELTLPDWAIGSDGMLHLGVEYENADGVRVSWPHAMMPWETEPARRAIDTSAWLGQLAP